MISRIIFRTCFAALRTALSCVWFGFLASTPALADDGDAAALLLADQVPTALALPSNWQTFAEASYGGGTRRDGSPAQRNERLSFDLRYDNAFAPGWRAVLADRLDLSQPSQAGYQNGINTLKEAYVSWQVQPNML
ncbi:MAG: hypothetical protein ABI351_07180, partial [Herbaspirillum sp.]